MGHISIWLVATLVDQNPFGPCFHPFWKDEIFAELKVQNQLGIAFNQDSKTAV